MRAFKIDPGVQPTIGIVGSGLIVAFSLGLSIALPPAALVGWVGLALNAIVPALIVQTVLRQNRRGARELPEVAAIGAIWLGLALALYAPGRAAPDALVMMPLIASVPVTLWQVFLFDAWPLRGRVPGYRAMRLAVLAITGGLVAIGDRFLATYDALGAGGAVLAPPVLIPRGVFDVRGLVALLVTSAVIVMALQAFEFWPIAMLARRVRLVAHQPWRGIAGLVLALGIAGLAQWVGLGWFGTSIGHYQARVGVSGLFGMFVVLVMMQGSAFSGHGQPARGLRTIAVAGLIALVAYPLYRHAGLAAQALHGGSAPADPDVWISTAMLAVTFPAMAIWADIFDLWPLRRAQ